MIDNLIHQGMRNKMVMYLRDECQIENDKVLNNTPRIAQDTKATITKKAGVYNNLTMRGRNDKKAITKGPTIKTPIMD